MVVSIVSSAGATSVAAARQLICRALRDPSIDRDLAAGPRFAAAADAFHVQDSARSQGSPCLHESRMRYRWPCSAFLPAHRLSALLKAKKITSTDLTKIYLDRLERLAA